MSSPTPDTTRSAQSGHEHAHGHEEHGHPHAHGNGTGHGHGHAHFPPPKNFERAFAIGIVLNLAFVAVEAGYGWHINSLALLADAAHNLSDVAGLALAWAAALATRLPANARHTYGWQRASILAAFINAVLLLVAMGWLTWEALERLRTPATPHGWTIILVACLGIVINSITALLFFSGRKHDLNVRGAFLHMVADTVVSFGVVISGVLILWQGWTWIDPVVSLVIAIIIVVGTFGLFRQSLHMLFDGVPDDINIDTLHQALLEIPDVSEVHDLHVWAMGTTASALTAHLVLGKVGGVPMSDTASGAATPADQALLAATRMLESRFGLNHVTLQIETPAYANLCALGAHGAHAHAQASAATHEKH